MTEIHKAYFESELGWIRISATDQGIRELEFDQIANPDVVASTNIHIIDCMIQLGEYFKGTRKQFSIQLDWKGTEFQEKVWNYLLTIPYGKTANYLEIAKDLGDEKAVRAVGTANGRNNIAIIVPCHRVIGSDGSLTGYAYGVWRKDWLLNHESEYSGEEKQLEMFGI